MLNGPLTIKNRTRETRLFNSRLTIAIVLVCALFCILTARLYYLQIYQYKHFKTLSFQNRIDLVPIPPKRGLIYDRNGILLADNIPVYSLMITPSKVKHLKTTIKNLQQFINISFTDLDEFDKQLKQHRRFDEIPLKLKLSEAEVAKLAVKKYQFPGVAVKARLIRHYPFNDLFSHVAGYVGRINTRELMKVDPANYAATNFIGKTGVEAHYESLLHGQVGYERIEANANGQEIRTLNRIAPQKGTDIYLTIDSQLQNAAKQALENNRGAVVALDPNNGEVLAFVSEPGFDANLFVSGISYKNYHDLQHDKANPLYNRILRGLYSPGSTIKPFIALAGLNEQLITKDYRIYDPGWYQIPHTKHIYHDWKTGGHGWVNLSKAIIQSCDTYFYALGHLLGIQRLDNMLNQFGLNDPTKIDLDGELSGNIPTPTWKYKMKGYAWYSGDTVLTAIGQGFLQTTPLELAAATATLANHGLRMQPHLIYAKKPSDAEPITYTESTPSGFVTLNDESYWNTVIHAMSQVTSVGTGYRFGRTPYSVASKTGTVQVMSMRYNAAQNKKIPINLRNNSLFIAFAPINHPKIAVAVIVENNVIAPNVARKILDAYLLKQPSETILQKKSTGD